MKNLKYILPIIIGILFISSCKKFLDVNHSPNSSEESRVDLVFPAGVEGTASIFGNKFMSLGAIWAQHWTSDINKPGYMGEDSYSVQAGDYSYDLRGWNSLYYGPLKDYEWVRKNALEQENWNYYLMATVMQCYTYHIMADLWDEIPVSEALLGDSDDKPAHFEKGEAVYTLLINRIDEALAKDFTASTNIKPEKDDLVFGGSMDNWIAFANTLKLKMYLRQRFKNKNEAKNKITELYNNGVTFLSIDAAFSDFKDELGHGNYWYESNLRGSSGSLRASNTLLRYLMKNGDVRLNKMFKAPGGGHKGIWQGDFRDNFDSYGSKEPKFSAPRVEALDPVYFISAVESKFLQAEALMFMGRDAADVKEVYDAAVLLNCKRYNVVDSIAEAMIDADKAGYAAFPMKASDTNVDRYNMLMMQKWIAMANGQGLEAFFDHNRTGIPKVSRMSPQDDDWNETTYTPGEFTVSVQGILSAPKQFPKRLLFSATERSKNPNTPPTVAINIPVWWNVEPIIE